MRSKHQKNVQKKLQKGNQIPRGIIVEIALFFVTKAKEAAILLRLDRRFSSTLNEAPRFWFTVCMIQEPEAVFKVLQPNLRPEITSHQMLQQERENLNHILINNNQENIWNSKFLAEILEQRINVKINQVRKKFETVKSNSKFAIAPIKGIIDQFQFQFQIKING